MLYHCFFSQIPIGKNIKVGKTELLNFMKEQGFTIIKDSKQEMKAYNNVTKQYDLSVGKIYYSLLFQEEVDIQIFYNKYLNISEIWVMTENEKNTNKLIEAWEFNDWEFVKRKKDILGESKYYKKNNVYVVIFTGKEPQINIFNYKPY